MLNYVFVKNSQNCVRGIIWIEVILKIFSKL